MTAPLEHRETADSYHGEVFRRGGYRVIACRDHIQWILQKRRTSQESCAGARWKAVGYFQTRNALARVWHSKTGGHAPKIAALPEQITRRATI
ncbi:hypothetical protein [Defluviimonas aestuarii]|uniref:hypothetical protein n=1 Tax=Albidovulum aestuarii TaxID=1130726 RepID=UPI00249B9457|nr:hypothetical protein [Defluviimonas aestuarii]